MGRPSPKLTPVPGPWADKDERLRADGTFYLIRYNGRWYAGTVGMQWYGWNFNTVYDAGLQLPHNDGITEIYEIEGKAERPSPIMEIFASALADLEVNDG